ncbi:uncharacterized protein METZ01_LOCUS338244, partial [marine metagenome]
AFNNDIRVRREGFSIKIIINLFVKKFSFLLFFFLFFELSMIDLKSFAGISLILIK